MFQRPPDSQAATRSQRAWFGARELRYRASAAWRASQVWRCWSTTAACSVVSSTCLWVRNQAWTWAVLQEAANVIVMITRTATETARRSDVDTVGGSSEEGVLVLIPPRGLPFV